MQIIGSIIPIQSGWPKQFRNIQDYAKDEEKSASVYHT